MKFQDKSHWGTASLSDVGIFSKGKGITKANILSEGIPCIRYGEIYTQHNIEIKKIYSYISQEIANDSQFIKKGDILFAGSGETSEEIGKNVVYLQDTPCLAGGDIIIFTPNASMDPLCLSYLLNSEFACKQKRFMGQGNAVVHIYAKDLATLKIPLPPLEEQKEIAHILSTQDEYINKLDQLIKAKEKRFLGLIQTLISAPAKNGQWATALLSDVAEIIMGQSPQSSNYTQNPNDTILIQGNTDLYNGRIIPRIYTTQITKQSQKGDIIVSVRAPVGDVAISLFETCIGRGVCAIRSNKKYYQKFLYYIMLSLQLQGSWKSISTGSTFESVNSFEVKKLQIPLPPLEEQQCIAHILSLAQSEVSKLKELKSKHQQQKIALMQLLLG